MKLGLSRALPSLTVTAAFLAACASAAPTSVPDTPVEEPLAAVSAPAEAAPELLLARPAGPAGPLVAYALADGRERFRLPAGMLSADARRFVAVESDLLSRRATVYDLPAGAPAARFGVRDLELGGVSPNGLWAVFTRARPGSAGWTTRFEVVETGSGQPAHILELAGRFELDAFSADGQSLFLIEHLPADAPDHYVIRRFDLSGEGLLADPVRSKGAEEIMAGYAWEGRPTPDGRWLLTLYLNTRRNTAFVHALDVVNKFPVCITLPSGEGDLARLKYYTLAPHPDGQRLFAANAALGVVAEVSLIDFQVVNTVTFPPKTQPALPADPERSLAGSLSAPDGKTLYFTNGWDIWAYAVDAGRVSEPFSASAPITGLALDRAGTRLFASTADEHVHAFPAEPAAR